jgi:hemerythrin-like metal-binding protein
MTLIEWREQFAIGLPEIDHEHRQLIEEINRLHARLAAGAGIDEVTEVLGGIESGISAHFALEEKNMQRLGYDGYAAHKADHESLLDDILDIADGLGQESYDPGVLSRRLDDWFGVHFRNHDAKLHAWLASRR